MAEPTSESETQHLNAVFDEDVVQSKDKKKIGVIVKTTRDDDSDESESDLSDFEEEKVRDGQVMVAWYKMNSKWNDEDEVKVVDENTVELVDRSILHGDIVRWVDKTKGIQKGQLEDVNVICDIKIVGTNYTVKNINAKKLLPLVKYVPFVPVVKGPWLGYIQNVDVELTLRLKNNSRCVISDAAVNSLHDVTDQRDEDSTFYCSEFYRGQQVRGPASVFKDAKWIVGVRPAINNQRSIKAVVEEIRVNQLRVDWQVCGFTGNQDTSLIQPDANVPSNQLADVIPLNHFKEASITIGDKALYTLTEEDVKLYQEKIKANKSVKPSTSSETAVEKEDSTKQELDESSDESDEIETETTPIRTTTHLTRGGRRTVSRPRRPPLRNASAPKKKKRYKPTVTVAVGEKICVEVVFTKTLASIVWQDGTSKQNIPSKELYPVLHLDELEFFPGDFVVDKRDDNQEDNCFGVIQTADFSKRICTVRWLKYANDTYESSGVVEEYVSVYDIADHKDYSFRTGDIVVRLASVNETVEDLKTAPAGEVVKIDLNGLVTVLWSDETISSVLPGRLYVLDKEDEEDFNFNLDPDSDAGSVNSAEWETASDGDGDVTDAASPFIQDAFGGNPNSGNPGELNPLEDVIMRSLAALNSGNQQPANEADHVIGNDQRTEEFINALDSRFNRENEETPQNDESENKQETEGMDTTESGNQESKNEAKNEAKSSDAQGTIVSIEHAPTNHHFINNVSAPHNLRTFQTAISRDIKLLRSHLPQGIYVKHFEDRTDLLSVLIVGPVGTPYEDGLFYFDLQLPNGYPALPPTVYYYSYCSARLNPNLYEEGKVCVSLLGTWTGKGSETWTSKSTLHQLFLSIQGLILNEEPYYNEAGFEKQRGSHEGAENSRMYNEMATIKMLQSMIKMVIKPPEIFNNEVKNHFKTAIPRVIKRMRSWVEPTDDVIKNQPLYPLLPLSKGFRDTVARLLDRLEKITIEDETIK